MLLPTDNPAITLRHLQGTDRDALVQHANNRAVWRNLTNLFPHPYTLADADTWIAHCNESGDDLYLAIDFGGQVVGTVGVIAGQNLGFYTGILGYWIGQAFWGRGIATHAVRAMQQYVFSRSRYRRLEATVFAWNPASMRVLEKCGFQREGVLRKSCFKDAQLTDLVVYATFKVQP